MMSYNGWNTYETWLVNLWFGDDSDGIIADSGTTDAYDLAEFIESSVLQPYIDDTTCGTSAGFVGDIVNAALREVDFRELAETWLADYAPEADD